MVRKIEIESRSLPLHLFRLIFPSLFRCLWPFLPHFDLFFLISVFPSPFQPVPQRSRRNAFGLSLPISAISSQIRPILPCFGLFLAGFGGLPLIIASRSLPLHLFWSPFSSLFLFRPFPLYFDRLLAGGKTISAMLAFSSPVSEEVSATPG